MAPTLEEVRHECAYVPVAELPDVKRPLLILSTADDVTIGGPLELATAAARKLEARLLVRHHLAANRAKYAAYYGTGADGAGSRPR